MANKKPAVQIGDASRAALKKIRAQLRARSGRLKAASFTSPIKAVEDDVALFRAAMADVRPLPEPQTVVHRPVPPSPFPLQRLADEQAALHESLYGFIELEDRLEGGDEPCFLRAGLSRQTLKHLRTGRWTIEREVDLHGCNREDARHLLSAFLHACRKSGCRVVRIVHGIGRRSPGRQGLLRVLVRGWLIQRREVLAYCQARPQDGGEGALIVLLRASR